MSMVQYISTHTLRKEGDVLGRKNPSLVDIFQPTPSARRVTVKISPALAMKEISTHTLRKEGDILAYAYKWIFKYFNPHPPQGG